MRKKVGIKKSEKDLVILILLITLIFLPLFFRPDVIGYADNYYYLNFIWGKSEAMPVSLPIIQRFFSTIPASLLFIKGLMYLITIFSTYIFYKTCKLITKHALYPTILLLIFTPFSKIFLTFETSLFGLPFMFSSLYFLMKYKMNKEKELLDFNIIFSLIFLFLSVIFWRFTIYYIPIFLIMSGFHSFYIFATILLIPFVPKLIAVAKPNLLITENHPIKGFWAMLLLFPAYFRKFNLVPVLILSWLTLFNYKFIYLLVPIAILNIAVLFKEKHTQTIKILTIFGYCALLLSTMLFSVTALPDTHISDAITQAQHLQKDLNQEVSINWSFGYYAIWHGIDTNYYGSYKKQEYKGHTVTVPNDKQLDGCKKIEEYRSVWIYDC